MEQRRRDLLYAGSKKGDGSIAQAMKSYHKEPITNDGTGKYSNIRLKPKTSGPYASGTEISIPITSSTFTVTEFENSYLHLQMTVNFYVENKPEITGDYSSSSTIAATDNTEFTDMLKNNQYVFLGWKASSHVIRDYTFLFNEAPVTTSRQNDSLTEHFLYSTFKAKGEISNKRWVFSPYQEVEKLDNSICGVYIPIGDLKDGENTQDIDVIIPFTELLPLEAFDEFPNKIFGELKFNFTTTFDGVVYTEVNPVDSIKHGVIRGVIDGSNTNLHLTDVLAVESKTIPYTHAFQQQGIATQSSYITGYDVATNSLSFATNSAFKITCSSISTKDCWSDLRGYEASSQTIVELRKFFSQHPFTVCAQRVERQQFGQGPTADGVLRADVSMKFRRVTDINILMPTNGLQHTVFTNPALADFQIQIGQARYPEQHISTLDPEFFEGQIQNSDFDSFFEATESYEHSLTDARADENGFRNPTTDDTCFVPIYSLERANAGELVFDGQRDATNNVKVEVTGHPLFQNYVLYKDTTQPPVLCLTSDTYWIFRIYNGYPNCQYVIDHDYDQAYQWANLEAAQQPTTNFF